MIRNSSKFETGSLFHFSLTAFRKKYHSVSLVIKVTTRYWIKTYPANMQDRANVGHQLAGLAKRRQICQRFANVANVLPTSLQTP